MNISKSRIPATFERLKIERKKALITFITTGDPDLETSLKLMHQLVEAGADIIELGVPFSDPMADGPLIQRASERALQHHISIDDVLVLVSQFRQQNNTTPLVLMGYLNPIEHKGYEQFANAAASAGVDAVLTVDMALEESSDYREVMTQAGLDTVFLVAPTSGAERSQLITNATSGFLYYVAVKGVTGGASADFAEVAKKVVTLQTMSAVPVAVGFGISSPRDAADVAEFADAVVVGSAIIKQLEEHPGETGVQAAVELVKQMRQAMDG